jgi:predicted nucleic acid-binding protein
MKAARLREDWQTSGWIVKQAAKNEILVIALSQTLDDGEVEAIALDL